MKTFIDTSPFIYLIENHPEFVNSVRGFFLDALTSDHELVTSVITVMELGVVPQRMGRHELIFQFEEFLQMMNISVEVIDRAVAETAYKLRAKYDFLKGMDALQISVAIEKECDQFLTNDKKLRKITEVKILLVEEL
jgi:predicted nucleic acid-binding protein